MGTLLFRNALQFTTFLFYTLLKFGSERIIPSKSNCFFLFNIWSNLVLEA